MGIWVGVYGSGDVRVIGIDFRDVWEVKLRGFVNRLNKIGWWFGKR